MSCIVPSFGAQHLQCAQLWLASRSVNTFDLSACSKSCIQSRCQALMAQQDKRCTALQNSSHHRAFVLQRLEPKFLLKNINKEGRMQLQWLTLTSASFMWSAAPKGSSRARLRQTPNSWSRSGTVIASGLHANRSSQAHMQNGVLLLTGPAEITTGLLGLMSTLLQGSAQIDTILPCLLFALLQDSAARLINCNSSHFALQNSQKLECKMCV